eukprot:jgi/Tetstr1/423625/TSEL_001397.t1
MSTLDYCPESLVFVVDTASEIQEAIPHPGGGASTTTRLELVRQVISVISRWKAGACSASKFGLMRLGETATWLTPGLVSCAEELEGSAFQLQADVETSATCDLDSLPKVLNDVEVTEQLSGRVLRCIIIYSRSNVVPLHVAGAHLPLRADLWYLHSKPVAGQNNPQAVFDAIVRAIDDFAAPHHFSAYVFEHAGQSMATIFKECMWFLSHPLQRSPQASLAAPADVF